MKKKLLSAIILSSILVAPVVLAAEAPNCPKVDVIQKFRFSPVAGDFKGAFIFTIKNNFETKQMWNFHMLVMSNDYSKAKALAEKNFAMMHEEAPRAKLIRNKNWACFYHTYDQGIVAAGAETPKE